MYTPKIPKDIRCPLEYWLDIFGGRWKSRILCVLWAKKRMRFGEIRSEMVTISDAALGQTLKEMAADGLLLREQFNEMPMRVEYSLTPKGESVIPILQSMCQWSGNYHDEPTANTPSHCRNCTIRFVYRN